MTSGKKSAYRDISDPVGLPDFDHEFINADDLRQFEKALTAPEASPLTAINDWSPISQRVRKPRRGKAKRSKDETREGVLYTTLKWPFLLTVFAWITVLSFVYGLTRLYIHLYEQWVTWRGQRQRLRRELYQQTNYADWLRVAQALDAYLGNEKWKEIDEYAYYDHLTINKVVAQLKKVRGEVESELRSYNPSSSDLTATEELRSLLEACVKNNFAGIENPRIYSETYSGTKDLVQEYIDEVHACIRLLRDSAQISSEAKYHHFKHLDTNFGRTALCLSGGATFAYYHFGVIKALLDNEVLPEIITGTSGGALVAALVATRTDDELKPLLVPALANRIRACHERFPTWFRRWWRTGARFDTLDWARQCSWFCRGSITFREAYERTGRILNVTCVPSDPHSPTILANYLTSPDCVIWSAVLASAAVPGILNPVVLMTKKRDGTLAPYSFGHKWKDGSLRTDIPIKALNLHFNVNFTIVSQVSAIRPMQPTVPNTLLGQSPHQPLLLQLSRNSWPSSYASQRSRMARRFPRFRHRTVCQARSEQMAASPPTPRTSSTAYGPGLERNMAAEVQRHYHHLAKERGLRFFPHPLRSHAGAIGTNASLWKAQCIPETPLH